MPYNGKANESTWIQFSPILAISYDDLALDYFYNITLENLPQADHARYLHLQFSSLYTTSRHDSALRLAALAISHAVYSRDTRNNIRGTQISRKFYGQAILAINAALKDTIEARSDETLYAVLLLCGYEVSFPLIADVSLVHADTKHPRLLFVMSSPFQLGLLMLMELLLCCPCAEQKIWNGHSLAECTISSEEVR